MVLHCQFSCCCQIDDMLQGRGSRNERFVSRERRCHPASVEATAIPRTSYRAWQLTWQLSWKATWVSSAILLTYRQTPFFQCRWTIPLLPAGLQTLCPRSWRFSGPPWEAIMRSVTRFARCLTWGLKVAR